MAPSSCPATRRPKLAPKVGARPPQPHCSLRSCESFSLPLSQRVFICLYHFAHSIILSDLFILYIRNHRCITFHVLIFPPRLSGSFYCLLIKPFYFLNHLRCSYLGPNSKYNPYWGVMANYHLNRGRCRLIDKGDLVKWEALLGQIVSPTIDRLSVPTNVCVCVFECLPMPLSLAMISLRRIQ